MQLSLRAMQHPSPRTTYKRDQVERAIGIVLYRRNTTGALLPVVKADLKRLIDIDRKPKAVRPDWQHDRHAFFDGPPPGRGRGIAYTAYHYFGSLAGTDWLVSDSACVLERRRRSMAGRRADWESDLERWLEPFLAHLSHRARRAMCPLYVAGLIGPGDRKSVQPMAERLGFATHDRLHHFVSSAGLGCRPARSRARGQGRRARGWA
jgi:hypothetical protein